MMSTIGKEGFSEVASRRMARGLIWLLAACAGANAVAADNGSRASIRVGAVSSLTGPIPFGESTGAAKAFFEKINAQGGVNGRRIELVVIDDATDPARSQKAAQQLIDDKRIVGLIGGASAFDCSVNAASYERAGLMSLLGTGVESACFNSSHIVPINTGPYRSLKNALQFARTTLRSSQTCAFVLDLTGMRPPMQGALDEWAQQTGNRLAHVAYFRPGEDANELVRQAIAAKCDAVVHTGLEPMVLEWVRAAMKTPSAKNLSTVFLTPAYTARVAAELGSPSVPIYCLSEFEPWSSRSTALVDWRETMRQAKVPLSSFSQGGYSSAQLFVNIVRDMDGEVTRKGFADAVRAVNNMNLSMLGARFAVGEGKAHNPNRTNLAMKLEGGAWRITSPFWMETP